jgi:hypothetical protein
MVELYRFSPIYLHGVVLNSSIKHRDNFTFYRYVIRLETSREFFTNVTQQNLDSSPHGEFNMSSGGEGGGNAPRNVTGQAHK